jgi:hypothetical protein
MNLQREMRHYERTGIWLAQRNSWQANQGPLVEEY